MSPVRMLRINVTISYNVAKQHFITWHKHIKLEVGGGWYLMINILRESIHQQILFLDFSCHFLLLNNNHLMKKDMSCLLVKIINNT